MPAPNLGLRRAFASAHILLQHVEVDESPLVHDGIGRRILTVRGIRVMLDMDLASVYQVTTKRLNEQVKRNLGRFPPDFMFRLTLQEARTILALRSQFATLKRGGHLKYPPRAFTEHGAVMLAAVLNSPIAVEAGLQVVRAFILLRTLAVAHQDLTRRLDELEATYDRKFKAVFDALRQLMAPPDPPRGRIGFHARGGER